MLAAARHSTRPPESFRRTAPRLLFVDDEPVVLRSIHRLMKTAEPGWDLAFADSAAEAIEELRARPVNVIVSDLHMPGMNGAALLSHVQAHHPEVVRLVLSGMAQPELVFRSVPVAHQFLTKPFDPLCLRHKLRQACELRELLDSPELRALVGGSNRLPSPPRVFMEMQNALANPQITVEDISAIIEKDVALSAQLIRLISSAYFGLPSRVRTPRGAVAYLGFSTVKTLVLCAEVLDQFKVTRALGSFSVEHLEAHSLCTAHLTRRLLTDTGMADDGFLAGMLHDIGKLVLAARASSEFAAAQDHVLETGVPDYVAEAYIIGSTHAEVGAYLLGLWGFPQPVIQAVAWHHRPQSSIATHLDIALAVNMANKLVENPDIETSSDNPECIDLAHLERLGLAEHLPRYRVMAKKLVDT